MRDPRHNLPFEHPEYLYPPSRNPYWKRLGELEGIVYNDHGAEQARGKWRGNFARPLKRLHVEVGCNAGHVILEWARRDPDTAFVGIDWKIKAIHRAGEKARARGLENVKFLRAHALRLQYIFGPSEIDFLAVYFPDPWPKKAQWKNRWVTAERLRVLAELVRPGGELHIKTDHPGYFEWMEDAVTETRELWDVASRTRDLHAGNADAAKLEIPDVTLFEKLFIKDGIPIQSLRLLRR